MAANRRVPRTEIVLREITPMHLEYDVAIGGYRRLATVMIGNGGVTFPHPLRESGESLGWEELDERLRRSANQLVALRRGLGAP